MASMPALPNAATVRESSPPSEKPRAEVREKTRAERFAEAYAAVRVEHAETFKKLAE